MMPIVFCASLAPCIRLKAAADTSCSRRNQPSTRRGAGVAEHPQADRHQQQADDHARSAARATMKMSVLVQPDDDDRAEAGLGDAAPA